MQKLFWFLSAMMVLAWVVPRDMVMDSSVDEASDSMSTGDNDTATATIAAAIETAPRRSGFGGRISIEREDNGHFYIRPMVNGRPIRMMVDTGATVVALTGRDAELAGLSWSDDDITAVAQGANGAVMGVRTSIDRIALGGIELRDVEAVIVPDGLPVTLLGQSVLKEARMVEIRSDRMVLDMR